MKAASSSKSGRISSHSSRGVIPLYAMNTPTTVILIDSVIAAVSMVELGMMIRGNESLRMSVSRTTIETRASDVASAKNVKSTMPISSDTG